MHTAVSSHAPEVESPNLCITIIPDPPLRCRYRTDSGIQVPAFPEIVVEYCVRQLVPSHVEISCKHVQIG